MWTRSTDSPREESFGLGCLGCSRTRWWMSLYDSPFSGQKLYSGQAGRLPAHPDEPRLRKWYRTGRPALLTVATNCEPVPHQHRTVLFRRQSHCTVSSQHSATVRPPRGGPTGLQSLMSFRSQTFPLRGKDMQSLLVGHYERGGIERVKSGRVGVLKTPLPTTHPYMVRVRRVGCVRARSI